MFNPENYEFKEGLVPDFADIQSILSKAQSVDLTLDEINYLLNSPQDYYEEIMTAANRVKERIHGNKINFYVPIYFSNCCTDNCLYCNFRKSNNKITRKRLTFEEFQQEARHLHEKGYKNIEIVSSTDPLYTLDKVGALVSHLFSLGKNVIMNVPVLKQEGYRLLKKAGLSWSWLWMETYDKGFFLLYHPSDTAKSSYENRIASYDYMAQAGLNVGLGFLMGLTPHWKKEIFMAIAHARYLKETYGTRISFGIPRFCHADGALITESPFKKATTDAVFRLMVALYRLGVRDCNIDSPTREPIGMIKKLWKGGSSYTNPEVKTTPGGYTQQVEGEQFDHYSYSREFMIKSLSELNLAHSDQALH